MLVFSISPLDCKRFENQLNMSAEANTFNLLFNLFNCHCLLLSVCRTVHGLETAVAFGLCNVSGSLSDDGIFSES